MELYTTADIVKAIAATVAPYILIPTCTALICTLFPNLINTVRRLMEW